MVRGVVTLPMEPVKISEYWYFVPLIRLEEAKAAGADYVGLDEYIEKLKSGWTDIDIIITMPAIMGKLVL